MLRGLWWFKKKEKKKKESCDGWKEEGIDKKRPVQCVAGVTLALWRKGLKSWSQGKENRRMCMLGKEEPERKWSYMQCSYFVYV